MYICITLVGYVNCIEGKSEGVILTVIRRYDDGGSYNVFLSVSQIFLLNRRSLARTNGKTQI